jgi:hypothetical protein
VPDWRGPTMAASGKAGARISGGDGRRVGGVVWEMSNRTRSWTICVVAIAFLLNVGLRAHCQTPEPDQLRFVVHEPSPSQREIGIPTFVYATGPVDPAATQRFASLFIDHDIPPGSWVFVDSPGGDVAAALELGRLIRQRGLSTYVGRQAASKVANWPTGVEPLEAPGECYSACTFVYLGGVFRFIIEGSSFGVHRFAFIDPNDSNSDAAQVTPRSVTRSAKPGVTASKISMRPDASGLMETQNLVVRLRGTVHLPQLVTPTPVWG